MGFRPGFQPYELINSTRVAIEKARAGVSVDLARVIARECVMPLSSTFSFGSQTSPPVSILRGVKQ
eukprot:14370815-Heterocapsa_arctica.AAC.1